MDKGMNRRDFLGGLGAVAAGAAGLSGTVASGQLGQVGVSLKRWRTGVGLNGFMSSQRSYGYKMDITQVLELIKSCGYDGVELAPWPRPYPRTPADAHTLKKQYDDIGLQILSLQGMLRGGSCGSADSSRRELKNQSYDKWIMLDLWNIPDIYRATIVGKQKLDDMLDILFPV